MAKGLSLARSRGVILADVEPAGPADRAGIDAVNTSPVAFVDALRSELDGMKPGDPVVLQIEREAGFNTSPSNSITSGTREFAHIRAELSPGDNRAQCAV